MSSSIHIRDDFPDFLWTEYRRDLVKLHETIMSEADVDTLRRHCHKLAGSAGLYGLGPLRDAALALQHCETPTHDTAARSALEGVIREVLAVLAPYDR